MADSEVDVYNMALNAIGGRDNVSATTEDSREAEVCRLWYAPSRDQVLRAAPWPSSASVRRLALAAERDGESVWATGDPYPGYAYAYTAPSDLLQPLFLTTYDRFEFLSYDNGRAAIMTNTPDAILRYNRRQTEVAYWDTQLRMAIVFALAAFISMPLNGKLLRARSLAEQANDLIVQARTAAANSDNHQLETVPDWISMRGYSGTVPTQRFIYPFGPTISVESTGAH